LSPEVFVGFSKEMNNCSSEQGIWQLTKKECGLQVSAHHGILEVTS
jgi:hypothetical protein